jgi:16S rRNA A1518/A1519 N6-dimethyltransferase RsmA/KsgA/DIM1 with predicted DNA glycosylase/AP lyase activity
MIEKKCRVEERIFVGKENFVPRPKIESSVLLFTIHDDHEKIDDEKFLEVIKK